jgi:hypothetical protein
MTCLYSGCERTLHRTQPLSISTNTSFCYFSYLTPSNFFEEADIRLGQEHKNSLLCPRKGGGGERAKGGNEREAQVKKFIYSVTVV